MLGTPVRISTSYRFIIAHTSSESGRRDCTRECLDPDVPMSAWIWFAYVSKCHPVALFLVLNVMLLLHFLTLNVNITENLAFL